MHRALRSFLSLALLTSLPALPALAGEPLIDAAQRGDVETVRKLLAAGTDVAATNDYGATALTYAADNGNVEILRLLIAAGADANHMDTFYKLPVVMWAAFNGHGEAVKLLVEHGADAARALRAGMMLEKPEIVAVVLATGKASPEQLTEALGLATAQELTEVVAMLEKAGARPAPPSDFKLPPEALAAFAGSYLLTFPGGSLDVDLKVEDGALVSHLDGQPPLPLEPVDATHFRDRGGIGIRLDFQLDGERVVGFQLHQPGAPDPFSAVRKGSETAEATEAEARPAGAESAAEPESAEAPAAEAEAPAAEAALPAGAAGRDWPAFRGPNAAGTAGGDVPLTWDVETGDNILWKRAVPGRAHSSPIVWDDRVFVTTAVSKAPEEPFRTGLYGDVDEAEVTDEYSWRIYALDKADGKIVWHHETSHGLPRAAHHFKATQANATPVTDGKVVVAMMGSEGLFAFDLGGKLLWRKDLGVLEVGWFYNPGYGWGHSSSPIIHRDRVIVQVDRYDDPFIAAYALADGRELWRTARENLPSWGTPAVTSAGDRTEIVTNGSRWIRGYDAATGKELWHLGPTSEVTVGTPVVGHGLVFVTGGYPPVRPIYAVRPGGRGDLSLAEDAESSAHVAWSTDRDGTYIPTPLVYGDHLYMTANNGAVSCYDARTGERLYRERIAGRGGVAISASPVAAAGRIYFASEDGEVYVGKAGPEYELLATNAMGEVVMATPAISGDILFIRTLEQVYAIGVAVGDGAAAGSHGAD